ncbi:MAG: amidase [bacterium]
MLHTLTVTELAARIRAGELSPVAVVEACLARIQDVERAVKAWVRIDESVALDAARLLESEARAGRFRGPLHGIPVGLKDIYHVAGMVTTSGASAFAHEQPLTDADAVARLKQAGAIVLGKTTTTEFAYLDPTVTRNPWNLEHTPGGSSSGSAAAVAARMVPVALGSQTVGSTLRPAAYCGIVGLKPTHGRISTTGATPLAWSLDHAGIFTRSVEDAALMLSVLADGESTSGPRAMLPPVDYVDAVRSEMRPPRLGLVRDLYRDRASPQVKANMDEATAIFSQAGAIVEETALPPAAAAIHDAGQLVMRVEAATFHAERFARHADSYRPKIRGLIEAGLTTFATKYVSAQQSRQRFREEMSPIFRRYDALLMPVVPAAAPKGLSTTGDPFFCAPWSFAGVPSIAVPSGVSDDGLPLAIQLVTATFAEDRLLAVARWCESTLPLMPALP